METDPSKWTKTKVDELTSSELDTLANWVGRFASKYEIVGCLNDGARPLTVAQAQERGYIPKA